MGAKQRLIKRLVAVIVLGGAGIIFYWYAGFYPIRMTFLTILGLFIYILKYLDEKDKEKNLQKK